MSSSNGPMAHQRNAHRRSNPGPTLKRRYDNNNRGCSGGRIGDIQEERNRYAPPQKRSRSQSQSQSQSHGRIPLYHHGSNMSRVSNYGDMIHSNSINSFHVNPNPQSVPLPLPYRKLDDFDSLPEWSPNQSLNHSHLSNFVPSDVTGVRFKGHVHYQAPAFTNFPNPMPPPMNHSNMVSVVSQALPQRPIVSKELSDLLSVLNNDQNEPPLGLSFDSVKLSVRHESAIKSLYFDMPRQCSSCGVRFMSQEDHSKHMDWHVRKNRMAKEASRPNSRSSQKWRVWSPSLSLWLSAAATGGTAEAAKPSFNGIGDNTQKTKEEEQQQSLVVPADENQTLCALCQEPFENFFSHEADDWMYRDAVYLNMKESGPIVHAKCMPDTPKRPSNGSREVKIASVTVPSTALVC